MKRFEITPAATSVLGLCLGLCACATGPASTNEERVRSAEDARGDSAAPEARGARVTEAALSSHLLGVMPVGLSTIGATTLGDAVYVLGGYSGTPHQYSSRDQSRDFFRYDLSSQSWDRLASVGPIQSVGLVSDGRYVYRVGGMVAKNDFGQPEDMHSVSDVARFDPMSGAWQALPRLPAPRSSHQAVLWGTQLIVVGGWALSGGTYDSEWQPTLASCDLAQAECKWQTEPMPFATRAHGAAVLEDKLYVLGGLTPEGSSDDVQIYDLKARTWSKGPALPKDNLTICGAVHDGRLYANGGDGTVYRLSVDGTAWRPAASLAFPRMFHAFVSSPKGLLALGGVPGQARGSRIRHVEAVSTEEPVAGSVWTLNSPSAAKNRQGVFLLGQQLYAFGGNNSLEQHDFEDHNFVASAQRLDLGSLEWKVLPDFPQRRQSMQTLVAGTEDKPLGLVVGGFGNHDNHSSSQPEVYGYDFAASSWSAPLSNLPEARSQFGLTSWDNAAWVLGGLNFDGSRKGAEFKHPTAVLRMDLEHPESGFLDAGFALKEVRRAFAGARLGERYYLTGGLKESFEAVTSCEVLDLKTKTSSAMSCPSRHRLGGELVPVGDRLYLVGGSVQLEPGGDRQPTTRIESYDPAADAWSTLSEALPFDEPKQLRAFAYRDQLLLYTANRSTPTVQVALIDPRALSRGSRRFVSIPVPAGEP